LNFSFYPQIEARPAAGILVIPFWESVTPACSVGAPVDLFRPLMTAGDFRGRQGELAVVYPTGQKEARFLALGLGKESRIDPETVRRAYAAAVRFAQEKKIDAANFLIPSAPHFTAAEALRAAFEGIALSNYAYLESKGDTPKDQLPTLLQQVGLVGIDSSHQRVLERVLIVTGAVCAVRSWVSRNADDKIAHMKEQVEGLRRRSSKLKITVFDRSALERMGMGLILAVARGAAVDPCLIQIEYQGNPQSEERIVLVGKGVSYDTGGLSMKTSEGMLTMKSDMAGAATAIGVISAVADLGLKVNLTVLAPMAENAVDAKSYKLGDVYRSYTGKTVEINNTDAEGRLLLADAIGYAVQQWKPRCLIDLATLTGSIVIALGDDMAGFYANQETLARDLKASADSVQELLWQMPLIPDYKEVFRSDIADLVNSGGREGGSIKAALFLQEFVGDTPWAHIDLAGPVFVPKPKHYNTTKATGYGVRTLVEFISRRAGS
jgi:leucyl aminopeptidase